MSEPIILYEDSNFLAINKPAGLLVHAVRSRSKFKARNVRRGDIYRTSNLEQLEPTLVDWLLRHYPEVRTVGDDPAVRPGIVHRLDRETSGVMLVPRTQAVFEYLKSLFQKHEIKKTYLALIAGVPKEKAGIITKPIGLRNGTVKRSVHGGRMVKEAVTEYRVKQIYGEGPHAVSLLEVFPKTGRTHQIRVHFASIGHPILGDALYGKKTKGEKATRLMLHAASIEFAAQDGKRIRIDATPPPEFSIYL